MGRTPDGNAVYTAAAGHDGEAARRAVKTLLAALGREHNEVLWLDVTPRVSFLWRVGAFCRRYSFLARVGQWLLRWSLKRDFPVLVTIARECCRYKRDDGTKIAGRNYCQDVKPRLQAKT